MQPTATQKAINLFQTHNGLLRTTQALRLGIQPRTLYQMRDAGLLVEESRGVYRLATSPRWAYPDLTLVGLRIPKGVLCLISALNFHNLTTQIPHQVYVALPQGSEKPRLEYPPAKYIWLSQDAFNAGIETHVVDGVAVMVYSVEKTIADCFRFRNKIGLDVAIEALKQAISERRCNLETLNRYAKINRVERVMRSYLETLL